MKLAFAVVLLIHALIHLMGPASAWGLAELPQLTHPIGRGAAVAWLAATVLLVATVVALFAWPERWWMVGMAAVTISQAVIISSWSDAKAGTLVNAVLLVAVILAQRARAPGSLNALYREGVAAGLSPLAAARTLTEADVAGLPPPVQRYLRVTGAIGAPRVRNFRVRFAGRIRSGPDARWMPFTAQQFSTVEPYSRRFLMDATMFGVPIQALHTYAGAEARMQVKAASLVRLVDARGGELTATETVTLLNDLCLLAPGALVSPTVGWEEVDERTVIARLTNAGHTVRATLSFNGAGELVDFASDDRSRVSADGRSFTRTRWSTPLSGYRAFGAHRLAGRGEARWQTGDGSFAYVELEVLSVDYDVVP